MQTRRVLMLVAAATALSGVPRTSFAADGGLSPDAGPDAGGSREDAAHGNGAIPSDAALSDAMEGGNDAGLPPPRHVVGKPCKTAADCDEGLICLSEGTDALGLGGPAGGLCTVDCSVQGQKDCNKVDTGSVCAYNAARTVAYCYELCNAGPVASGDHKCHDRSNMGCFPSASGTSFCYPLCSSGADCAGRSCDPVTGLCVDQVTQPLTIGTACDPGPPPSGCPGPCATLGSDMGSMSNSFCSKTCIIGDANSCEVDSSHSGPQTATCALRFADGEAAGDVGECMELCDCDDDCKNPDFVCTPKSAEGTGRKGTCYPKLTFTGLTPGQPCHPTQPVPDAAPPPAEGGAPPDAGVADAAGRPALKATGGCDCRFTPRPPTRSAGVLALFFALGLLVRRRTRTRV